MPNPPGPKKLSSGTAGGSRTNCGKPDAPAGVKKKKCSIDSLMAACQHEPEDADAAVINSVALWLAQVTKGPDLSKKTGPRRDKGGVLHVVPSNSKANSSVSVKSVAFKNTPNDPNAADKVEFTAKIYETCGFHPLWEIRDPNGKLVSQQVTKGVHSFAYGTIKESEVWSFLGMVRWLRDVKPKIYTVACKTCNGGLAGFAIHVYPNETSGFSIDFKNPARLADKSLSERIIGFRKQLEDIVDVVNDNCPNVEINCKVLEGSIAVSNYWREDDDGTALWTAEIEVALEPVFSIEVKLKVRPLNVPPLLYKYCDAYFFLSLKGAIKAKGKARITSRKSGGEVAASGSITFSLGVALEIAKQYNVLTVEAKGATTVAIELTISFDGKPSIEIAPAVVWYPLTLSIKVELFDGWVSIEEEWEAFEKKTLKLASIQLQ